MIVGWAKRSVPTIQCDDQRWWARRKSAFAHPTNYEFTSRLMPPLRLADVHRAIGLFQRAASLGMGAEDSYARGSARCHDVAAEGECQVVDTLLQRRRFGSRG